MRSTLLNSVLTLLGLLLGRTLGTEIINRGIILPCLFYLPENERIYYLYSMQLSKDLVVTKQLPGSNETITLRINFCQSVTADSGVVDTVGAPFFTDNSTATNYTLSYFESLTNTTIWSMQTLPNKGPEDGVSITGASTLTWPEGQVFNPTFEINCARDIAANNYTQNMDISAFNMAEKTMTISVYSSAACGYPVHKWISVTIGSVLFYRILLLAAALALLLVGYKTIRAGMCLLGFLSGAIASAVMILEGSNPNEWTWVSITVYSMFTLVMAVSLGQTGYYYPTGILYTFAALIGYITAGLLCDRFELYSRIIAGYYALNLGLPMLLVYLAYKNMLVSKVVFTSVFGAILLTFLFARTNIIKGPQTLADLMDLKRLFKDSFFNIILMAVYTFIGYKVQWKIHSKYGGGNASLHDDFEELMDQQ